MIIGLFYLKRSHFITISIVVHCIAEQVQTDLRMYCYDLEVICLNQVRSNLRCIVLLSESYLIPKILFPFNTTLLKIYMPFPPIVIFLFYLHYNVAIQHIVSLSTL